MTNKNENKNNFKVDKIVWILIDLSIIALFWAGITHRLVVLTGNSMQPTNGNLGFAICDPNYKTIERFDVIAVRNWTIDGKKQRASKRVIGLPGEKIHIENNQLFINDVFVDYPYAEWGIRVYKEFTFYLGEDEYFIMGDNRLYSDDSYSQKKAVKTEDILCVLDPNLTFSITIGKKDLDSEYTDKKIDYKTK